MVLLINTGVPSPGYIMPFENVKIAKMLMY
jgi:hypothetical protein